MNITSRVYLRALARVSRIHKEISSKTYPSVSKLADIFEVNERTIKRDLAFLRDEFSSPLKFDRRKKGFFYSIEGWSLPPQRLSEGDLLAFFIAENALKLTGQDAQALQLKTSLAKIASLLPDQLMIDISALGESVSFQNPAFVSVSLQELQRVAGAATGCETIEFDYFSIHHNEHSHRRADVHLLHNFMGDWFAVSFDHAAKDFRDFHVGRMSNMRETGVFFEKQPNWDPYKYLNRGFSMMRGGKTTAVEIRFDKHQARWIRERRHFHPEETREELADGGLGLSFKIGENALEAVARFCLQYAGNCIAVKPKKLRDLIKQKARNAYESH